MELSELYIWLRTSKAKNENEEEKATTSIFRSSLKMLTVSSTTFPYLSFNLNISFFREKGFQMNFCLNQRVEILLLFFPLRTFCIDRNRWRSGRESLRMPFQLYQTFFRRRPSLQGGQKWYIMFSPKSFFQKLTTRQQRQHWFLLVVILSTIHAANGNFRQLQPLQVQKLP